MKHQKYNNNIINFVEKQVDLIIGFLEDFGIEKNTLKKDIYFENGKIFCSLMLDDFTIAEPIFPREDQYHGYDPLFHQLYENYKKLLMKAGKELIIEESFLSTPQFIEHYSDIRKSLQENIDWIRKEHWKKCSCLPSFMVSIGDNGGKDTFLITIIHGRHVFTETLFPRTGDMYEYDSLYHLMKNLYNRTM